MKIDFSVFRDAAIATEITHRSTQDAERLVSLEAEKRKEMLEFEVSLRKSTYGDRQTLLRGRAEDALFGSLASQPGYVFDDLVESGDVKKQADYLLSLNRKNPELMGFSKRTIHDLGGVDRDNKTAARSAEIVMQRAVMEYAEQARRQQQDPQLRAEAIERQVTDRYLNLARAKFGEDAPGYALEYPGDLERRDNKIAFADDRFGELRDALKMPSLAAVERQVQEIHEANQAVYERVKASLDTRNPLGISPAGFDLTPPSAGDTEAMTQYLVRAQALRDYETAIGMDQRQPANRARLLLVASKAFPDQIQLTREERDGLTRGAESKRQIWSTPDDVRRLDLLFEREATGRYQRVEALERNLFQAGKLTQEEGVRRELIEKNASIKVSVDGQRMGRREIEEELRKTEARLQKMEDKQQRMGLFERTKDFLVGCPRLSVQIEEQRERQGRLVRAADQIERSEMAHQSQADSKIQAIKTAVFEISKQAALIHSGLTNYSVLRNVSSMAAKKVGQHGLFTGALENVQIEESELTQAVDARDYHAASKIAQSYKRNSAMDINQTQAISR